MKNRIVHAVLILGLLAVPTTPVLAQGGGSGRPEMRQAGSRQGPIETLLEHRADLKLTGDQVTRLEQLQKDLLAKTSPVQEQLRQLRSGGGVGGREEMQPLMQQLRTHNQEAMRQAQAILTAEQRELARSYMPRRSGEGAGQREGRRGRGGSRGS